VVPYSLPSVSSLPSVIPSSLPSVIPSLLPSVLPALCVLPKTKKTKIDYLRATYDENDNINRKADWNGRKNRKCQKLTEEDIETIATT